MDADRQIVRRALPSPRAGDPLGIGSARAPAPVDTFVHSIAEEDENYARALVPDKAALDEELKEGYWTVEQTRDVVVGSNSAGEGAIGIDPETIILVDTHTDYKIFIAGDNVYTREELYDHFAFRELGVEPEDVFAAQEIGVFPARRHAMDPSVLEYVARDAGDDSVPLTMIEDLVKGAARPGAPPSRPPLRVAKTKVYVGKERWEDFLLTQRMFRSMARVCAAQRGGAPLALPWMFAPAAPLALENADDIARREEDLRRREDALRAREEESSRRIEADLRRIEAALGLSRVAPAPAAQAQNNFDDSVPL